MKKMYKVDITIDGGDVKEKWNQEFLLECVKNNNLFEVLDETEDTVFLARENGGNWSHKKQYGRFYPSFIQIEDGMFEI